MKHFVLHDALKPAMWAGVGIIALGVALVGMASTVGEAQQEEQGRRLGARDAGGDEAGGDGVSAPGDALFGVLITLAGTFVQSVQYTYEEKVMSGDVSAPPWLLIGVEGVTGTLLSTFVLCERAPGCQPAPPASLPLALPCLASPRLASPCV